MKYIFAFFLFLGVFHCVRNRPKWYVYYSRRMCKKKALRKYVLAHFPDGAHNTTTHTRAHTALTMLRYQPNFESESLFPYTSHSSLTIHRAPHYNISRVHCELYAFFSHYNSFSALYSQLSAYSLFKTYTYKSCRSSPSFVFHFPRTLFAFCALVRSIAPPIPSPKRLGNKCHFEAHHILTSLKYQQQLHFQHSYWRRFSIHFYDILPVRCTHLWLSKKKKIVHVKLRQHQRKGQKKCEH